MRNVECGMMRKKRGARLAGKHLPPASLPLSHFLP